MLLGNPATDPSLREVLQAMELPGDKPSLLPEHPTIVGCSVLGEFVLCPVSTARVRIQDIPTEDISIGYPYRISCKDISNKYPVGYPGRIGYSLRRIESLCIQNLKCYFGNALEFLSKSCLSSASKFLRFGHVKFGVRAVQKALNKFQFKKFVFHNRLFTLRDTITG